VASGWSSSSIAPVIRPRPDGVKPGLHRRLDKRELLTALRGSIDLG
jgi:hypothetical protein